MAQQADTPETYEQLRSQPGARRRQPTKHRRPASGRTAAARTTPSLAANESSAARQRTVRCGSARLGAACARKHNSASAQESASKSCYDAFDEYSRERNDDGKTRTLNGCMAR
jgi:hypothetical protein